MADPKEILDDAAHRGESLQMGGRLEPAHLPCPLAGRLMRDLGSIVVVLPGTVDHGRHHGTVRRGVTAQLEVEVLESDQLASVWSKIDDGYGEGYRWILMSVSIGGQEKICSFYKIAR